MFKRKLKFRFENKKSISFWNRQKLIVLCKNTYFDGGYLPIIELMNLSESKFNQKCEISFCDRTTTFYFSPAI